MYIINANNIFRGGELADFYVFPFFLTQTLFFRTIIIYLCIALERPPPAQSKTHINKLDMMGNSTRLASWQAGKRASKKETNQGASGEVWR